VDTHVALWVMEGDARFGAEARAVVGAPGQQIVVSAASVWEIAIKAKAGKLQPPDDLLGALGATGFRLLSITPEHALAAGRLPLHHRDPFDRMLVAQAVAEGHTLVTADAALAAYDVALLPADR